MSQQGRARTVPLFVYVSHEECAAIQERMSGLGISNMSAYVRKMALNGYILDVDLAPVRELVSLLRRCSNNLNQVAIHANTYGVYQQEVAGLQKDYDVLWEQTNKILAQLAAVVEL